jgi:hypothetical protein
MVGQQSPKLFGHLVLRHLDQYRLVSKFGVPQCCPAHPLLQFLVPFMVGADELFGRLVWADPDPYRTPDRYRSQPLLLCSAGSPDRGANVRHRQRGSGPSDRGL